MWCCQAPICASQESGCCQRASPGAGSPSIPRRSRPAQARDGPPSGGASRTEFCRPPRGLDSSREVRASRTGGDAVAGRGERQATPSHPAPIWVGAGRTGDRFSGPVRPLSAQPAVLFGSVGRSSAPWSLPPRRPATACAPRRTAPPWPVCRPLVDADMSL